MKFLQWIVTRAAGLGCIIALTGPAAALSPDRQLVESRPAGTVLTGAGKKGAADTSYVDEAAEHTRMGLDLYGKGRRENLVGALAEFEAAIGAYARVRPVPHQQIAQSWNLKGEILGRLFRYAEAIEAHKIGLVIAEAGGAIDQMAFAELGTAQAMQGLSHYADSIPHLDRARQHFDSLGPQARSLVGDTWLNQGIAYEGMKDYEPALEAYQQARRHYVEVYGGQAVQVAYVINNIAWVYRRMERFDESFAEFSAALPIIDRHEGQFSHNASIVRINLGLVEHQRGNHDEAIRWNMRAMPYIRANLETTYDIQRWAFDALAGAYRAKGDMKRAIAFGKLAVNAHQSIRAMNAELGVEETEALTEEWHFVFQRLADMLIAEGRFSEAQAVLNMEKEQEVFEFLRRDADADMRRGKIHLSPAEEATEAGIDALPAIPLKEARELTVLMARLDAGEATEAEEDRALALQDRLEEANARFEAAVDGVLAELTDTGEPEASLRDTLDATGAYQELLAGMDRPAAILQIAALPEAVHLFLTLPNLALHEEVPIAKETLSVQVFETLQSIEAGAPNARQELEALGDVLLAPVLPALEEAGVEVVMLNLNGFLRYVPFAALHDGERYAVERFAFVLYSTAVPTQFVRPPDRAAKAAGFGVTRAHPGFDALPGVRDEIEAIFTGTDAAGILPGEPGFDAEFDRTSLRRALLRRPGILHIASHFSLVPGRENASFLLLGDGSHLALSEIRTTRALSFRGVDLLTLSACQTARAGDGSEIEGFGATAQLNGASAVLASLWPVSDDATPALMLNFYGALVEQGVSKAEALRMAQIALLRGEGAAVRMTARQAEAMFGEDADTAFSHPYFWSAFVLMGNWL